MTLADVHITDTVTGETRIFHDTLPWGEASDFLWGEGNYSCDCNRSLHFQWAAGQTAADDDRPCGDERFTVRIVERGTTRVLYADA